jgi:hypothetical protein
MKVRLMHSALLAVLGISLLAAPARAEDPKFEFGKAEDVKEVKGVEWDASAEFGLIITTGNSETNTISGAAKASRKTGANKLSLAIEGAFVRSGIRKARPGVTTLTSANDIIIENTTSSKNLTGRARYDRYLTELNSLFLGAVVGTDEPAGKKLAVSAQLGYSRSLYKSEKHEAVAEIGYDFTYTKSVTGDPATTKVQAARLFAGYKGKMTDTTNLDSTVEVLPNILGYKIPTQTANVKFAEDTRVNFHVGITSKITKSLSVNTSLDLKYDNRPSPLSLAGVTLGAGFVPAATALDSTLKASLIYSLF